MAGQRLQVKIASRPANPQARPSGALSPPQSRRVGPLPGVDAVRHRNDVAAVFPGSLGLDQVQLGNHAPFFFELGNRTIDALAAERVKAQSLHDLPILPI